MQFFLNSQWFYIYIYIYIYIVWTWHEHLICFNKLPYFYIFGPYVIILDRHRCKPPADWVDWVVLSMCSFCFTFWYSKCFTNTLSHHVPPEQLQYDLPLILQVTREIKHPPDNPACGVLTMLVESCNMSGLNVLNCVDNWWP